MRRKARIDETDYRPRVEATRMRIRRERLGITALEQELERMLMMNRNARICGEEEPFDEAALSSIREKIALLETEARSLPR